MTIAAVLRDAAARLAGTSDTPRLDAEVLMAHALGRTREALLLGGGRGEVPPAFAALLARRLADEPVAYIVGSKGFWTLELAVSPAVLIPRPDSETLIEAAIAHFGAHPSARPPARILDLGTGSGALLLAALAEWPEATGAGIDVSGPALAVARANAVHLGFAGRATFEAGDWRGDREADLVLCNPPYVATGETLPRSVVRYEPTLALFAGSDGLDAYRRIAPVLDFAPGGVACIEVGAMQAPAAGALFAAQGFAIAVRRDIAGRDRCLVLTRD